MIIQIKLDGVKEVQDLLDSSKFEKAMSRSLNKLMDQVRVASSKKVTKRWDIKKGDLTSTSTGKARLYINRARPTNQKVILFIDGRPLSLSLFNARQITGNRMTRRVKGVMKTTRIGGKMKAAGPLPQGVMVSPHKGKNTLLKDSFMAKMKNGHVGVFTNIGGRKIEEKGVISIPSMFGQPEVVEEMERVINDKWTPIFIHEAKYLLKG